MKDVHEIYVAYHKSTLSYTSASPAVSYSRCTELWKLDELRHIKLARHKPGFSKCNTCYELKQKYRKAANKEEKSEIKRDHEEHIALNRGERRCYYNVQDMACAEPEEHMSIITDHMVKTRQTFLIS